MRAFAKRKVGLVGYGFIAESGHLPAYAVSDAFDVVAVADGNAARREAAARALPNARIYEDYGALLAREAGAIDLVDITAPPYVHAEVAHAALDAKLHVLCEKPLATTAEDARALVEHAARAERVLYPVQNYRHAPVIRAVREVLDAGLIGDVHEVTLSTQRATHARGVKEWNEHWRREKRFSGGGIAMDHGSHTLYLAFDWLRSYPSAITAKTARTMRAYDTEDWVSGTITFPTGLASIHLSWTAGTRKVIYTLHGALGAIRVEDSDIEVAIKRAAGWDTSKKTIPSEWMDAGHSVWFESMFDDVANAIDRREYVGKPAEDAVKCIELITAAYASAADGAREQLVGERRDREQRSNRTPAFVAVR